MTSQKDLNGVSSLWKKYKETKDVDLRNQLVEKYLYLVKSHAFKVKERLPDSVDFDDLVSDGLFGLMDAIEAFDPKRGVRFESFSARRIYGSMIDALRTLDFGSRIYRRLGKKYAQVLEAIKSSLSDHIGNSVTVEEICKHLDVSLAEAKEIKRGGEIPDVKIYRLISVERGNYEMWRECIDVNEMVDPKSPIPGEEIQEPADFDSLVSCLPQLERMIVVLYHRDGWQLWRIGQLFDISESRTSQIHSAAVQRIKDSLCD